MIVAASIPWADTRTIRTRPSGERASRGVSDYSAAMPRRLPLALIGVIEHAAGPAHQELPAKPVVRLDPRRNGHGEVLDSAVAVLNPRLLYRRTFSRHRSYADISRFTAICLVTDGPLRFSADGSSALHQTCRIKYPCEGGVWVARWPGEQVRGGDEGLQRPVPAERPLRLSAPQGSRADELGPRRIPGSSKAQCSRDAVTVR